jgi:hypothetical protein
MQPEIRGFVAPAATVGRSRLSLGRVACPIQDLARTVVLTSYVDSKKYFIVNGKREI